MKKQWVSAIDVMEVFKIKRINTLVFIMMSAIHIISVVTALTNFGIILTKFKFCLMLVFITLGPVRSQGRLMCHNQE